ncbi:putative F-box protein At5g42430 isoform X1 [Papaver somniferum]|uniref:putative F-box protein At5g42430 isoform X1 n=1 Tax=Papaver somniferum TaxID=3469 RepID=UPI000E6FBF2F|nr:putative F-box protein At5g42430 isoform X1 [Papaver somniferum]
MRNFNHLQSEIMLDIITRLPVDSILNCKLVCRPWRDLVSHHPSFYQMYISHLNHSTDSGKLSFLVEAENQFHYFEYDENNKGTPIDSIRRININPAFENVDYFHYGSVNGLIYLYKWRDHPSCICNPVTREYVMLPTPETSYGVNEHIHVSSGFGLRCTLLAVARGGDVLGDFWIIKISKSYNGPSVFANGALRWVDKRGRVLTFDLTEEKFREPLSPPPSPHLGVTPFDTVGELDGVLYYVTGHDDDEEIIKDRCLTYGYFKRRTISLT